MILTGSVMMLVGIALLVGPFTFSGPTYDPQPWVTKVLYGGTGLVFVGLVIFMLGIWF